MHTDQVPYRGLYDEILDYEGDALYGDVVRPFEALLAIVRHNRPVDD